MRGRGRRPVVQPWRLWLACLPVALVPAFDVWDLDAPWAGSLRRELVASAAVTLAMAVLASGAFWAVVLATIPLRRGSAAVRRLRLRFDPGAGTCLWAADEATRASYGDAVDAASLPLSTATVEHVEAMVARYDGSLDWGDPGGASPWGPAELAAFERDAAALGERLAAELGPGFELRRR